MSKRSFNNFGSDQHLDLMEQVHLPDYIYENFEKDSVNNFIDTNMSYEYKHSSWETIQQKKSQYKQRENPKDILPYQKFIDLQNSQNQSNQEKPQKQIKDPKGKQYSKNYRQKKKYIMKGLQQQNRFLKQKIDELSFRLKQAEIQVNKLKHSSLNKPVNVVQMKEECLKQIQQIFQANQKNLDKITQYQQKFSSLNAVSNKHKMDLLNYFMNSFFENLITDMQFYLLNGLIQKTGLSRRDQKTPVSRIDLQVYQIYQITNFEGLLNKKCAVPQYAIEQLKKFKKQIQELYQGFLKLVSQANLLENMAKPADSQITNSNVCKQVQNYLKLQIYFERVKYRKDVRQMRQIWFKHEQMNDKKNRKVLPSTKKSKIN